MPPLHASGVGGDSIDHSGTDLGDAGIAVIASAGSAYGTGPFAFNLLAPEIGNLVLQVFELPMVVVFLSLPLAVGHERTTARRLNESEELFRRIFETSVAGMLIATRDATGMERVARQRVRGAHHPRTR
jgi:hypothetical protein